MCCIYDFRGCGHRDIDTTTCTNPNPITDPCKPISTDWNLPSHCTRCRESFLRTVAKRTSVATREATRAALDSSVAPPTLFAWPEKPARKQAKPSRRGPLRSDHLTGIPESPTIVREDRGWSAGLGKPLPCLPTPADTVRDFSSRAIADPSLAQDCLQTHPPPRVLSTTQQTVSLSPSLAIIIPQGEGIVPPATSQPHHTVSLLHCQVIATTHQSPKIHHARSAYHPIPAARSRPTSDRNGHGLKGRDRSAQLRDIYKGTEKSHAPAAESSSIMRKTPNSYPAWTSLPSQVEKRTKEAGVVWQKVQIEWDGRQPVHRSSQELFLNSPAEGITTHLDRGEFPSCLQPADRSQTHELSRLSTTFDLYKESGKEPSIEFETCEPATIIPYTPYSGIPAVQKRASEIPLRSYAAHAARKAEAVEFETRKSTSTPTDITYNPISTMTNKGTSRFSAPVPIDFEIAASSSDRYLTSEDNLSGLSAIFDLTSRQEELSIEFGSADSGRVLYSADTPTINTLYPVKSLSELSAVFDMEAQIELETHSRRTPTTAVGTYDCYNPLTATFAAKSSTPPHELPNLERHSMMNLGGTRLERVFQTWA